MLRYNLFLYNFNNTFRYYFLPIYCANFKHIFHIVITIFAFFRLGYFMVDSTSFIYIPCCFIYLQTVCQKFGSTLWAAMRLNMLRQRPGNPDNPATHCVLSICLLFRGSFSFSCFSSCYCCSCGCFCVYTVSFHTENCKQTHTHTRTLESCCE